MTTMAYLATFLKNNSSASHGTHAEVCAQSRQSWMILCNLIDCSWSGSFVYGILQARIPERTGGSDGKESAYMLETGSVPESRGSPGGGNGNPRQYSAQGIP